MRERIGMLTELDQYVGQYFSMEWVRKNILMQSDEDIDTMKDQMKEERDSGEIPDEDDL